MAKNKITDGLRQKANGVWERSEITNGKRRWFSSLDPEEVWRKRNAALGEAENEQLEKDKGPLFSIVADAYEERVRNMKNGTQRSYLPAIVRARDTFGEKHMREIEPYMISEFLQGMSGMAKTTVSNQKSVLNAIFQTWIESPTWRGDKNPSKIVSIPRGLKHTKREPPTDDQVKIVKDHYLDPDALPAVVFLCTGERRGEACGIQLKDINFENKKISINNSVEHIGDKPHVTTTKTPAGVRKIPLLSMLDEALQPLQGLPEDTYILSGTNEPLTTSRYNRIWANFWHKYGYATELCYKSKSTLSNGKIKEYMHKEWKADVCAHQFRHEYVCMLCLAGVPEEIAILLVGHANVQMIHQVYLSLKPQMIESAGNKLNDFLNKKV
nr:tyrosine-type recombinase/integrase [uncultured Caproiciproducens sp.]